MYLLNYILFILPDICVYQKHSPEDTPREGNIIKRTLFDAHYLVNRLINYFYVWNSPGKLCYFPQMR